MLEKLVITGGNKLHGDVYISGAKNSALPILATTILAKGRYSISNIPALNDIKTMNTLLNMLGVQTTFKDNIVVLNNLDDDSLIEAPYDLVSTMRASILVLGATLAKKGEAKVSLPGGCAIGERPVDMHISALEKMGAIIDVADGYIHAKCSKLKGAEIYFDRVTVTGTENIMIAATIADGVTVLDNAATEPEIIDLACMLRSMGAKISGEGTSTIEICGVDELRSTDYRIISDRIEAGTFLAAVLTTGGDIRLHHVPVIYMGAIFACLEDAGLSINIDDNVVRAVSNGKIRSVNIDTEPYPGFPTDMQPQFMAAMLRADGVSVISENIFENRFMHVAELNRMGADIDLIDHKAIVKGVKAFTGAPVMSSDLRASAGLIIAALAADHVSEVQRIYHLDRGYESFEKKLSMLGADIKRVKSKEHVFRSGDKI